MRNFYLTNNYHPLKTKQIVVFSKLLIKINLPQNTQGRRNDYHSENRGQKPSRATLFRRPNFREGIVTQYCDNRMIEYTISII